MIKFGLLYNTLKHFIYLVSFASILRVKFNLILWAIFVWSEFIESQESSVEDTKPSNSKLTNLVKQKLKF